MIYSTRNMKAEDIKFNDITRILFGSDAPVSFLLELVIRFLFLFILLIITLRLSGKSQTGSQNRIKQASIVSLAAAIGIPMMSPTRGLLPAIIIAIVIVGIQRLLSLWAFSNQKVANLVNGKYNTLVADGVFQLHDMHQVGLSKERLTAAIRQKGILHLGMIERMYMEANGSFTIIESQNPRPGLSLIPVWDKGFRNQQQKSEELHVCSNCGNTQSAKDSTCSVCKKDKWEPGVIV
ncbi:DUF421 domain-containing protein [Cytophagaceae bacterium DM2B3-1]|uniref:DUF421 domain-containing protein n=2 Tax=Xanthocytophaga flava TaxID=3048013 RepID=A0ABT7CHC9_9BACT|nr:DUF421 domain-containing protein [Xanthocytophaga flavus]